MILEGWGLRLVFDARDKTAAAEAIEELLAISIFVAIDMPVARFKTRTYRYGFQAFSANDVIFQKPPDLCLIFH
jgi:hypothetical protein